MPIDADLTRLVSAWPTLPESIKAAVLAVVSTAVPVEPIGKPKRSAKRSTAKRKRPAG